MSHAEEGKHVGFKGEVVADDSGKWVGNALVFTSEDEARAYVSDLYARWTLVRSTRVVPSDDTVNAAWQDGRLRYQPQTGT